MSRKIYVISLETAIERKNHMVAQFTSLNINNYDFFDAINGKDERNAHLFNKYNDSKRMIRKGKPLNKSELGCFASHYLLWEKCIEQNESFFVLEDDLIVHNGFLTVYQNTLAIQKNIDFFWLESNRGQPRQCFFEHSNFGIFNFEKEFIGTLGYFITPIAAKILIKQCREWIYPVDDQMAMFYFNKISHLGCYPPCVEHSGQFESQIDHSKQKMKYRYKISREVFNARDRLYRFVFNKFMVR